MGVIVRVRVWNLMVLAIPASPLISAGSTYCCIAALSLLGALDSENHEDTIHWLVNRQISSAEEDQDGGFNGRVNKLADTCYAFWAGASLDVSCLANMD